MLSLRGSYILLLHRILFIPYPISKEVIILDKSRIDEILEYHEVIDVIYDNDPVCLEPIISYKYEVMQVKNLMTNRLMTVAIKDLEEIY